MITCKLIQADGQVQNCDVRMIAFDGSRLVFTVIPESTALVDLVVLENENVKIEIVPDSHAFIAGAEHIITSTDLLKEMES